MMLVSIFVSRLDISDLVNNIKMYTNLIKNILFEMYIILFLLGLGIIFRVQGNPGSPNKDHFTL